MNHVGTAIIFTTLILFIGFGVFAFAQFVPNFNFGVLSAIVLLIALLVDLIFLPALILAKKETPAE
jgi:predicted RND superfamily exporter protein